MSGHGPHDRDKAVAVGDELAQALGYSGFTAYNDACRQEPEQVKAQINAL
jgi:hypothetical protein